MQDELGGLGGPPGDEGLGVRATVGAYRLRRLLGAGRLGPLWEAVDTGTGVPVALRVLGGGTLGGAEAQARFDRAAAAMTKLEHRHVVRLISWGGQGARRWVASELLDGEDVGRSLQRQPAGLPVGQVADIMLAICAAVMAGHERNICHGALGPRSIFCARTPTGEVVPKLLDLGVGWHLGGADTPESSLDRDGDQRALGEILHEALTGRAGDAADTSSAAELPEALKAVVLRARAQKPSARFATVHDLGRALLPFASPRAQVGWADHYGGARPAVGRT